MLSELGHKITRPLIIRHFANQSFTYSPCNRWSVCVCVFAGAPDRYKWTRRNGCSVLFGSAQAKTLHVSLRAPQPQLPSAGHGNRPDRNPQHPQHHQVNAHASVQWPYPAQDVLLFCCRMNRHNSCHIEFQYNIKQLGAHNVQNNNSHDVHDVRSF